MSSFDIFEDFCQTVESLLAIMEMEAQYLKASRPGKLNSLMGQKTELLHKNKALTEQIFDGTLWNSLEKTQQQKINHLVKSVVLKMKENLDLLDLSKRGNKKLLDIFFKKIKVKTLVYTAFGKMHENAFAPSLTVRDMV